MRMKRTEYAEYRVVNKYAEYRVVNKYAEYRVAVV